MWDVDSTMILYLHKSFFITKEWWLFGQENTCLKTWNLAETPHPWKEERSPMRDIPGAECPSRIRIDLAHTWPIGVGKDFCASSIILLAKLGFFGAAAMPKKLEVAYQHFREWCYYAKEHTQLKDFSYGSLKVTSFLVSTDAACVILQL